MAFADDYIEVSDRIREFKDRFPEGSLQSLVDPYVIEAGGKPFVVYGAAAYRTPDDPRPGIGWAWEPIPGPTPYTRDSELMNAETSAWGRAIVALGFASKKIASAEEVRNRSANPAPSSVPRPQANPNVPSPDGRNPDPGAFICPLPAHKGLTIRDIYKIPADASGKNDGAGYLTWAAFKMEPKADSGREFQEAAAAFLRQKNDEYDRSVLDPDTDAIPFGDPGRDPSDEFPFE